MYFITYIYRKGEKKSKSAQDIQKLCSLKRGPNLKSSKTNLKYQLDNISYYLFLIIVFWKKNLSCYFKVTNFKAHTLA